jgi:hypothetical protein
MIADHGGFAHDDTNVMLLVANPSFTARTVSAPTATTQVAPTIIKALGLDPTALDAVRAEGTAVLPDLRFAERFYGTIENRWILFNLLVLPFEGLDKLAHVSVAKQSHAIAGLPAKLLQSFIERQMPE